ncbi:MAG: hypothetical protein V4450_03245 [Bacteroidota bacterium]
MNFINRFFLQLLLLPSGIYRKMGVNIPHLKAILTTKLIMDDRRPNSIHQAQKKKQQKPIRFATLGMMLYTALLGCFFLVAFAFGKDALTKFTIYFSFYIFILTSTLISDFTSVLIDVRDNIIILPKPINDKTFVLARLLHIVIHVTKLILPMTLPGLITVGIMYGAGGIFPFLFLLVAASLFTIFLINALYIFILKVTTPEKFKSIISYFQIFFGIFIYASYQIVPRLVDKSALTGYSISSLNWAWLLPPYWFAGSWQYLYAGEFISPLVIYFLVSIALPILSLWLVINYFAPAFNQKLSMISGSEEGAAPVITNGKKISSTTSAYISSIARWITEKGAERMSFLNTWKITGRSREFKMKVYPSIGYMLVYLVLMFMNKKGLSLEQLQNQELPGSKLILISMMYFSSFILMVAIGRLIYSDKYKAAWIYYITPIQLPGKLLAGALKSAIVKFCLPILAITSVAAIGVVGPKIIPNLLLGILNQLFIVTFVAYLSLRVLPFSLQEATSAKGGTFIRGLFSMLLPFTLGILHFFVYRYTVVIIILAILSAIATWLMMDALRNKTWEQLTRREYEG